jgi:hypothetical protein
MRSTAMHSTIPERSAAISNHRENIHASVGRKTPETPAAGTTQRVYPPDLAARQPIEEFEPQFGFQILNLGGQSRLSDIQPLRRAPVVSSPPMATKYLRCRNSILIS